MFAFSARRWAKNFASGDPRVAIFKAEAEGVGKISNRLSLRRLGGRKNEERCKRRVERFWAYDTLWLAHWAEMKAAGFELEEYCYVPNGTVICKTIRLLRRA